MVLLAQAQNLVSFFVAIETLSIPLYILCATNMVRERSLESGLKYLIVGSLGSATLLYGMAFLYGGSGSTDFARHLAPGSATPACSATRWSWSASAWSPSGSPSRPRSPPSTSGRPTSTRARRRRSPPSWRWRPRRRPSPSSSASSTSRSIGEAGDWQPALAVLAAASIVIGNVGALGQDSLKRLLGYSGVAQAGYILGGLVVASEAGVNALVFYLAGYLFMNLAAFSVIVARERETAFGDDIARRARARPRAAAARLAADDLDAGPGRAAGDGRLHRQALPDRGPGRRRLHLARRLHRRRHDDLARLLPAGGGGDVDAARAARRRPAPRRRSPAPRPRPTRSTPRRVAAPTSSARRCSPRRAPSSSASSRSRWSSSPQHAGAPRCSD